MSTDWLKLDDKTLTAQMLTGKEEAFETFFHSYYPPLYRFALARLNGNEDAAEEVAQSTMCKAIAKLQTYRGEANLFLWLRTFCKHEIFAYYERKDIRSHDRLPEEGDPELKEAHSYLGRGMPDPQEVLQRQDVIRLVRATLDCLPERYGDVLEWKYILGFSVLEIAKRLSITEKAVESLLSRARQAFRSSAIQLGTDLAPKHGRRMDYER